MAEDSLMTSLLQDYKSASELTVSHVFKRRKEELCAFFLDKNRKIPKDKYVTRESLNLLKKSGWNKGVMDALSTDGQTGIIGDIKDIKRRQAFFGKNTKILPVPKKLWDSIKEQVQDPLIKTLGILALVMMAVGVFNAWDDPETTLIEGAIEGFSILVAILLITSIAAGNDYMKEKQFISLEDQAKNYDVSCIRGQNGTTSPVNAWDLVVGDIITFEAGDRVPADCLLIDSIDLQVDEAYHNEDAKTIIAKRHTENDEDLDENHDSFLLAESLVVEGSGRAVVLVVTPEYCTRQRRVLRQDQDDAEVSPLQEKLSNIGSQIGKLGIYCAVILFLTFLVRGFITMLAAQIPLMSKATLEGLLAFVTTCITLIMVAVPEGLPLAVSLSVAYSLDKMKKENLLIKNADSQEKMGSVKYFITGKTGTLTEANMRVYNFRVNGETHTNSSPDAFSKNENIDDDTKQLIKESILYNCTAKVEMSEDARYVANGNGTESGMLTFLQDNGEAIQDQIKAKVGRIRAFVPWTPIRKMETTAVEHPTADDLVRIYAKGSPEHLLAKCDVDEEQLTELKEAVANREMGMNGIRPFAYAYKDMSKDEFESLKTENNEFRNPADRACIEEGLTFLAIFGLRDELRKNIKQSIGFATKGGIKVIMVSGDNLFTARAMAVEAGITNAAEAEEANTCISGADFEAAVGGIQLKETENEDGTKVEKVEIGDVRAFDAIASKLKVLARAEPNHKLALVTYLQAAGHAVAVTGEGLNDATALKKADVGFAMGSGCELAKDQADMVILDDNFGSSMTAVSWGRNIYDNVRKFIQFQMTVNISCCFLVVFSALIYGRSVFSVIHLLWINMIMDTFAALALATEPPHSKELRSAPINAKDAIMSKIMWRQILSQAAWQLVVLLIMLFLAPLMMKFPYELFVPSVASEAQAAAIQKHDTVIFTTFVYLQLFNFFNCRKLGAKEINIFESFFNNWIFLIMVAGLFAMQWLIVTFGGALFQCTPLTVPEHLICMAFAIGGPLVCLAIKFSPEELADKIPFTMPESKAEKDRIAMQWEALQARNAAKKAEWESL